MRYRIVLVLCILLTFPKSLWSEEAIKIGVISGLSGAAAKWNRFQNMGAQLAQEEYQVARFPIELVFEDSATEGKRVIAAFNKLTKHDKVDAIFADDFGFAVAPVLPLATREKVFLLAIGLPHDRYCESGEGYFYSASSQFSNSFDAFDKFFEIHPEVKKIGIVVFDDQEWGDNYHRIWKSLAKKHNVEIVGTHRDADLTPDFKTPLTKILKEKPQAIFLAHEPEAYLKAARQLGFDGYTVSANNVLEMLADAPAGREELEGVYIVDPVISEAFRKRFRARFSREPILEAYAGYEAIRVIAKSFQKDRQNPAKAIKTIAYDGVAGRIDFTGKSCAGNEADWGLFRYRDGKLQPAKD